MKIVSVLFVILFSIAAQAQIEFGLAAGLHSNQAETDIRGANIAAETGFRIGILAFLPIYRVFGVRSGFQYVQRYSTIDRTSSGQVDLDFSYFDVPLTAMLKLGDYVGIFAGPVLSFNHGKDVTCSLRADCGAQDIKSFLVPWQAGLSARIFSQMGAEVFYEYIDGDLATNVANMSTVGGNIIFYFE